MDNKNLKDNNNLKDNKNLKDNNNLEDIIDDCVVECAYLSVRLKRAKKEKAQLADLFMELIKEIKFEQYKCTRDCGCNLCEILLRFNKLTRDDDYGL